MNDARQRLHDLKAQPGRVILGQPEALEHVLAAALRRIEEHRSPPRPPRDSPR